MTTDQRRRHGELRRRYARLDPHGKWRCFRDCRGRRHWVDPSGTPCLERDVPAEFVVTARDGYVRADDTHTDVKYFDVPGRWTLDGDQLRFTSARGVTPTPPTCGGAS